MKFLNKLYTKAIFSADNTLNVTASDLGENMISGAFNDEVVARLRSAVGTVGSLAIFCDAEIRIDILKTSPTIENYYNRILTNGYIGGTLSLYDDVNNVFVIEEVSLDVREIPNANGTEAAITFIARGNMKVNKDAIGVIPGA